MDKKQILEIIDQHKKELSANYGVNRIGLFGSYARNEQYENSDIDIVIEIKNPDLFLLVSIKNYLQDLLQKKVDIVRYRERMNEGLKRRILRDAIYV
ncbi:MAG: nucleotidyltransferase family protein [Ignavibacteriae bacterium]|nr:nucleotidyltransferase family protein [Ignavibacteriota bacterium]